MSGGWNFADIWERHAERFPAAPAQIQGARRWTWAEFDQRAHGVAAFLLDAGLAREAKVAQYLTNCPEYLESMFGVFKAGLVPVNTNYRYVDDELVYLWDNGDVEAVVFHASFSTTVERIRRRLPRVKAWLCVEDGTGTPTPFATAYDPVAASDPGRIHPPGGRSGDDLFLLYTGGTTGRPKGVMWRQDDLVMNFDAGHRRPLRADAGPDALAERVDRPGRPNLPATPLMHGTGAFAAMYSLLLAGSVVTLTGRHFKPDELLDAIGREKVFSLSIAGDVFARPLLAALDREPGRFDISSLRVISSSGVMWSEEAKAALLRHNPSLLLVDSLGSSEAFGLATSTASAGGGGAATARFTPSRTTRVLSETGEDVTPGSGIPGRLARAGRIPLGYHKDPEKSAATFVEVDGQRYSIPGDWALVEADGSIRLLGRGSQCINTGGEKVFPEEVEEILKLHPGVADAAVVGVPDEHFGERIAAVVVLADAPPPVDDLTRWVKTRLASYKAPRDVVAVESLGRGPNGKLDYQHLRDLVTADPERQPAIGGR